MFATGPQSRDWRAAINLEGGPLVGESAEVLLRLVEGEDSESCYSSLLDKIATYRSDRIHKLFLKRIDYLEKQHKILEKNKKKKRIICKLLAHNLDKKWIKYIL